MKLYKFNQFKSFDSNTIKYINNNINETEYLEYLNNDVLNESVYSYIKDKILDILYTYIVKAYEVGYSILDKVKTFFNWFIKSLNEFKTKHPSLYKVIVLTFVTILVLIISMASVHAEANGQPIPKDKINVAIGWLDNLNNQGKVDFIDVNKAIAHLVDIRDGKVDINGLGENATNMANAALNTTNKIISQSKTDKDGSTMKLCLQLLEKGNSYAQVIYNKYQGGENLKLIMK